MVGGFSRPRKDKEVKVSGGQRVKAGQILIRGLAAYKRGINVGGLDTLFALCPGEVYFTRRKIGRGKAKTYINVRPLKKESAG